ncbi:MAG: hypothetical protein H7Z75_22770 [Ferruginibacter sp.]|nr:hypothetical protein [Cytophagales bacterium]
MISRAGWAQDDLLGILNQKDTLPRREYTLGTFKSSRLINGHSVETRAGHVLEFVISHRFGRLNSGAYNFFGLDDAVIRLALEYGVTDRLNVGIGRNSFQKTYDGFVKYKLLRQSEGPQSVPVSVVLFSSVAYKTEKSADPNENRPMNQRLFYANQVLIARKLSQKVSLQLSPVWVHRTYVDGGEKRDVVALGLGGRYKLTKRVALNAEYYYRLLADATPGYYNALAVGFDLETGGHVFQLHFTNANGMIEKAFVAETTGDFTGGDIHFGFNISRSFNLGKKEASPPKW